MNISSFIKSSGLPVFRQLQAQVLPFAWLASGYLVARYYRQQLAEHGLSPYALAERDDHKATEFYDHLFAGIEPPQHARILDIGCGLGDLIPYLQGRNVSIDAYLGLDLVDAFVRACRQRYGSPYRFRCQNFVHPAFQPQEQFEIVANVGCMVSRVVGYESYIAYCCTKMMRMATKTVLFNMITDVQDASSNYLESQRVGQITPIAKDQLVAILDRVTTRAGWSYSFHDVRIYPDATDTFVALHAPVT